MRYNKIRKMDISNGPGVRVSIFMQGCAFHCRDCFNPETHDFNGGKEFTAETIARVLELCAADYVQGLSILGGEPLHPQNLAGSTQLAQAFKQKFPHKTLWVWSGFLYEDVRQHEIMQYIDVLVDGQFKTEQANLMLQYKGSTNQRVIDVVKSQQAGKVILWEEVKDYDSRN